MNLRRLVSRSAWQSSEALFTATRPGGRAGTRRRAQGGATDGRVFSIPGCVRPLVLAPADSSKSADAALLVMMGGVALALGLIVYLTDRNAAHAALIPTVAWLSGSNLFGALGQWLPAAIHPFAFSMFTAAALPSRSASRYGACAAWCAVNIAFELGQHPLVSGYLIGALQASGDQSVPGRMLAKYFLHGTFDGADMIAAVLGALAAAAVVRGVQQGQEKNHAS